MSKRQAFIQVENRREFISGSLKQVWVDGWCVLHSKIQVISDPNWCWAEFVWSTTEQPGTLKTPDHE